jgi:predicted NBD/HSP70 family sugar kinase
MRQRNAAQTLAILYRSSPATMAALQRESGLSRRTLELILTDLEASSWITSTESTTGGARPVGRPARSFAFRYDAGYILALQLEAGQIQATVADLSAHTLGTHKVTLPIKSSRQHRLELIDTCVTALLGEVGIARSDVAAVTVATPGIVHEDGTVDLRMTMPEWSGFSLVDAIGELFDCPIRVENDAKLAALGEKWSLEGTVQDFAYIFADNERLGVGLVIRNELYRGLDGAAGEVTWARSAGMMDLADTVLAGLEDDNSEHGDRARETVLRARAGDPSALAEIDHLAKGLIPIISTIAWFIAPEEIIIGGTLGSLQDLLLPALEELLAHEDAAVPSRIRGSRFGDASVVTGCLRMCVENLGTDLLEPARFEAAPGDWTRSALPGAGAMRPRELTSLS